MNVTTTTRQIIEAGFRPPLMAEQQAEQAAVEPTEGQRAELERFKARLGQLEAANAASEKRLEDFNARAPALAKGVQEKLLTADPDDNDALQTILMDEIRLRIITTWLGTVAGRRAGLRNNLDGAVRELQTHFMSLGAFDFKHPVWDVNHGWSRVQMAIVAIDKLLARSKP